MQQGRIRAHQGGFSALYRLLDILIILFSLFVSCLVFGQLAQGQEWLLAGLIASGTYVYVSESFDLYRSWRASHYRDLLGLTSLSWGVACAVLLALAYFSKSGESYSRLVVGAWFVGTLAALLSWRLLVRSFLLYARSKGLNSRSAAIVGMTKAGFQLADDIAANPQLGIKLAGFYDDRSEPRGAGAYRSQLLGDVQALVERARGGEIDLIYIALPMSSDERISEILKALGDTTATVHLVPDFVVYDLLHSRWQSIGATHTLSVYDTPIDGLNGWLKRLVDLVFASVILAAISPLLLAIAVAVKLSSPGPVLFKQKRYGLDGRAIDVWKFRSMTTQDNGAKVVQAKRNDARITAVGAVLRRTSLDELPQFFNVLQGSMSIVGPRPHAVAHNEEFRPIIEGYMLRHKVKPGITGWAQVNGWRGETDTVEKMSKRVEHDLYYIRHWSLWMDIKIIILTMFKGFVGKNAY